jgi:hypothetical protein
MLRNATKRTLPAPRNDTAARGWLHRLVLVMNDHARAISNRRAQASKAILRLTNP